jgi:hypothetical protein
MKKGALGFLALLVFCQGASGAEDLKARAARLQKSAIVVDTHEDVPEQLEKEWIDIGARQKTGHVDIPRWKEGGVTAPFLAAYVPSGYAASGTAAKKALELIDLIHRLAEARQELRFADSVAGIRAAKADGKIAILIGVEGGHAIEDSLGTLSAFYRLGARYMTLTHTNTNHWADSAGSFFTFGFDPKKYVVHNGLTDFGGLRRDRRPARRARGRLEAADRDGGAPAARPFRRRRPGRARREFPPVLGTRRGGEEDRPSEGQAAVLLQAVNRAARV